MACFMYVKHRNVILFLYFVMLRTENWIWLLFLMQLSTEVMQLYSDDDEVEKAFSGENVKIKLKNVEEEVRNGIMLIWLHLLTNSLLLSTF